MAVTGPGFSVPVFAASAVDAWGGVQELRARPEIRLVPTPRHASVLLVAGSVPGGHAEAVDRVHDQMPHPRATVGWHTRPDGPSVVSSTVGGADDLVEAVLTAHGALRADADASEPDRRPDQDAHEWRGVGPNGQGGEGMMGGTPYGRPMAMTGDDRDGLALDQLHLRLGPFLDALPAGLVLDVTLQGDVLQEVTATRSASSSTGGGGSDPGQRGLRWLAHALHVQGLDHLASGAADLARRRGQGEDVAGGFARLRRRIRRSGLLWVLRGTGATEDGEDARSRWVRRLDALDEVVGGGAPVDDPPVTAGDLDALLEGRTLGDAITTIVSFDLDRTPEGASR